MKRRYQTEEQIVAAIDRAVAKGIQHDETLVYVRERIKAIQRREENPDDRGDTLRVLIERDEDTAAALKRVTSRLRRLKTKLAELRTPLLPAFGTDQSVPV